MAEYTFEGRVIALGEKKTGNSQKTGNPWASQDIVLEETHGQYPKKIVVNVFGVDRLKDLDFKVGEEVKVSFDINAQEYQGRWFNKLSCWQKVLIGQPTAQTAQPSTVAQPSTAAQPCMAQNTQANTVAAFPPDGGLFDNDDKSGLPF